jgi:alpha-tubulin suppressor-like RCC1 family protein
MVSKDSRPVTPPRRWPGALLVAALPMLAPACRDAAAPEPATHGPWIHLAAGGSHSCALDATGLVFCWGSNLQGQLGLPLAETGRGTPVRAAGALRLRELHSGNGHLCGLTDQGAVHCWGYNNALQLGSATAAGMSPQPVPAAEGLRFAALAAGGYHNCALDDGGTAYCWGWGSLGQLGDGATATRAAAAPVAGGRTFSALTPGDRFTCALTAAGAAYCWGAGHLGQLGAGEPPDRCGADGQVPCALRPVPVAGEHRFTHLAAGYGHACGLAPDGSAHCWGLGVHGQLGHGGVGADASRAHPAAVATPLRFRALAAGGGFTCGLADDGAAHCWGYDEHGQLGGGLAPVPCADAGGVACAPLPAPVAGGHRFTALAADSWHACALDGSGTAYCWGRNEWRQLGDGTRTHRRAPVRVGGH